MLRHPALIATAIFLVTPFRPAEGQSRVSGYQFTPWAPTRWSQIEMRARCDGGPSALVPGGPIKWTVEFRNRDKTRPVSFSYEIRPPTASGPPALARVTLKPKGFEGVLARIDTDSCDRGFQSIVDKVRFGEDTDATPYSPPDRS